MSNGNKASLFLCKGNLYNKVKDAKQSERLDILFSYILEEFKVIKDDLSDTETKALRKQISSFLYQINEKLVKCSYHKDRFETINELWFKEELKVIERLRESTKASKPIGRKLADFQDLSESSKRRRTASLRAEVGTMELAYSAQMCLREDGEKKLADSMYESLFSSNGNATNASLKEKPALNKPAVIPFTANEALALLSQAKLTKEQYLFLRKTLKDHNADVLPCYNKLLEAKKMCYPDPDSIRVTEGEASIEVQAILDLTAKRLVEANKEVFQSKPEYTKFVMLSKWGFDSSTAHSEYKQKTLTENLNEGSIILTAVVPLQIYFYQENDSKLLFWQNERPSSTRLCRPVQIIFGKETAEKVREVHSSIAAQIDELHPCHVQLSDGSSLVVTHRPILSMIDGKVSSIISETAAQSCSVCKATPKLMNDVEELAIRGLDKAALNIGISVLHAWIRSLELCLNLAYRLFIKKSYTKYTQEEKKNMADQQRAIQQRLREGLGLLVDKPKSSGYGNTNDGNTARRFFESPEKTAAMTGLDKDFLDKMRVILIVLSCGYAVDVDTFRDFAMETARIYVKLYPWYWMSSGVHKVLIHGADFIKNAPIPIGLLSEEALESRHKDLRYFRIHHTRLCSRKDGNCDLLHCLLISSDPLLYGLRPPPKRKSLKMCPSVVSLLKSPEITIALPQYIDFAESDSE